MNKALMESKIFKNFTPISNFVYLLKIIEKVVNFQVDHHSNTIHDTFQSAFK